MKTTEKKIECPVWKRSILEVLDCPTLAQELEKSLIQNKELFLHHTIDSINCTELIELIPMLPETSMDKNFEFYFHLRDAKDIDFKISKKRIHKKLTLEDDIYKGVKLTLVYS